MAEYIERGAFKAEIRRLSTHYLNEWDTIGVLAAADRIPAADVVPMRHGRWLRGNMPTYGGYKCSVCGGNTVHYKANYCPNCGALMKGGDGNG